MNKEELREQIARRLWYIATGAVLSSDDWRDPDNRSHQEYLKKAKLITELPILKERLEMVDELVESLEDIVSEPGYYPEYSPIKRGREVLAKARGMK